MIKTNAERLPYSSTNIDVMRRDHITSLLKSPWIIVPFLIFAIFFIPDVRNWMNREMYLKMLVQIPSFTILSFMAGLKIHDLKNNMVEQIAKNGSSALVFLFGSQTFWMIPRSLDLAVNSGAFEILMAVNLIVAGFLFGVAFKTAPFVLKTAFSIYGLSMALAMGIIYIHFNSLICAVFTIEMQHVAGKYTLYIFPFVFILFLYRLFYNMARLTD